MIRQIHQTVEVLTVIFLAAHQLVPSLKVQRKVIKKEWENKTLTHHNIPESQGAEQINYIIEMKVLGMLGVGHQTQFLQATD